MNEFKDFYSVLGISSNASSDEIKKSYHSLAFNNHPDRGGSLARMSAINEAYSVLSTSSLKLKYDEVWNEREAQKKYKASEKKNTQDTTDILNEQVTALLAAKAAAKSEMLKGLSWFSIALLVSLISYGIAASNPDGGNYYTFTFAILYGIYRLARGAYYYFNPQALISKTSNLYHTSGDNQKPSENGSNTSNDFVSSTAESNGDEDSQYNEAAMKLYQRTIKMSNFQGAKRDKLINLSPKDTLDIVYGYGRLMGDQFLNEQHLGTLTSEDQEKIRIIISFAHVQGFWLWIAEKTEFNPDLFKKKSKLTNENVQSFVENWLAMSINYMDHMSVIAFYALPLLSDQVNNLLNEASELKEILSPKYLQAFNSYVRAGVLRGYVAGNAEIRYRA